MSGVAVWLGLGRAGESEACYARGVLHGGWGWSDWDDTELGPPSSQSPSAAYEHLSLQ